MFFARRLFRYNKTVDLPLREYYGLNEKINILVKEGTNELTVTILYKNKQPQLFFQGVPTEVNDIIHSFCGDVIEIRAKLTCPKYFPFQSPIWQIIKVKHNLYNRGIIDLEEYYAYVVECVNRSNDINWSSAYGFETEILRFFTRINHFESIVENV
jgi:hypothetical protein